MHPNFERAPGRTGEIDFEQKETKATKRPERENSLKLSRRLTRKLRQGIRTERATCVTHVLRLSYRTLSCSSEGNVEDTVEEKMPAGTPALLAVARA